MTRRQEQSSVLTFAFALVGIMASASCGTAPPGESVAGPVAASVTPR